MNVTEEVAKVDQIGTGNEIEEAARYVESVNENVTNVPARANLVFVLNT